MRYEFHPEALDEFEDAAHYYADCQPGLELRFIACVESALRQVSEAPTRWRNFEEDVRRCLVHVFPYAVLYSRYRFGASALLNDLPRQIEKERTGAYQAPYIFSDATEGY